MKAINENLQITNHDLPILKPNEVLVKVCAFAINRADILQRKGKYPPPAGASPLMGLEVAGIVENPHHSTHWKVGDKVFGLVPSGGYAEYAAVDAELLMKIPERFSFEQAAAIPEVFLTAYLGLVQLGGLKFGETALIHGGAGGVGTAAIQIAKQLNCRVITTANSSKHDICEQLGADLCLDYKQSSWREQLQNQLGKTPVDVILDTIGASYFSDNLEVLAMDGRMTMIALIGGGDAKDTDLRKIIGKRLKIEGSTLRNRNLDFQRNLNQAMSNFAMPLFETGKMRPVIDCIMNWTDIAKAHQRMENGEHIGKIVMKIE
ncbi:MAG: NAD(P)H-quinone oxidoreductase [Bacteroidales bacterium]|jgi:putative PIG3 family NAD(P)H quinone oxidoreductase|nr:NAD(P)H-quinone oxidoreductase [Bacteroidales bacterium]